MVAALLARATLSARLALAWGAVYLVATVTSAPPPMMNQVVNFFLVNATIVIPALVVLALIVSSTARHGLLGLLRFLARPLLIAAVVALVYDGTRTMAGGSGFVMTSLLDHWTALAPATLAALKNLIVTKVHPLAWSSGVERVLKLPAWLVLGVLGLALAWLGRRRRPIGIFVN